MPDRFSRRTRRLLVCAIVTLAVMGLGMAALILWPRPYDPVAIGAEGRAVLARPDRVDAFVLEESLVAPAHTAGSVRLADGFWSNGPGVRLTPQASEQARRAVLDPTHYDLHPQPDLCAFAPSWALRFTRADAFVDVLIDRDCTRDLISAPAHGPPGSPGTLSAGGGKLTRAGHDAFHALQITLSLPAPALPKPGSELRFAASPADIGQ